MSKTVKLRDEDYQDQTYTVQNGVKIPLADGSGMATAYFAEGTLPITVNGNYDVRDKAAVNVAVSEGGAGSKLAAIITRSITELTAEDLRDIVSIGDYAFCGCAFLEDVTLPSGLQTIGGAAFQGCSALTSISLPSGLRSIGDSAFSGAGLTSVTIPDSVTALGTACFEACSNLASITLPSRITAIPSGFCQGAPITAIDFPDTVTSIGSWALFGCSNLTRITVRSIAPPTVSGELIFGPTNYTIYVPYQSLVAYQSDSSWSRYASHIQAIPTT